MQSSEDRMKEGKRAEDGRRDEFRIGNVKVTQKRDRVREREKG